MYCSGAYTNYILSNVLHFFKKLGLEIDESFLEGFILSSILLFASMFYAVSVMLADIFNLIRSVFSRGTFKPRINNEHVISFVQIFFQMTNNDHVFQHDMTSIVTVK